MHVDGAVHHDHVFAPDRFKDAVARHDLVGIGGQEEEEFKLFAGQLDLLAIELQGVFFAVDGERGHEFEQDEAAGDFGYSFKQPEPGADPREMRLIVAVVRPGSVAAAGGMKPGDEIVSVDGQDVTGANSYLHGSLTQVPEGTVVHLGLKDGPIMALTAGKRP